MLERFAAQSLVEYEGELIFSKEKFAELIVRECAGVIVEEMKITPQVHSYWGPFWDGLDSAQKMINKHFGVE
jgi:hypothetical protein